MHCNKEVSEINLAEDYTNHLWDIGKPFLQSFGKRSEALPVHVQIVCGITSVWDLLKKKPYLAGVHDDFGRVPLMVKWHDIAYKKLLRCGADPNAKDNNGNSVLIYHRNNPDIVEELVEAGANINATNNVGESLISIAMKDGLPIYPFVKLGATLPTIPRDKIDYFFLSCLTKEPVEILSKMFATCLPSEAVYLHSKIWAACFDKKKFKWIKTLEKHYSKHVKSKLSRDEETFFLDVLKRLIHGETSDLFDELLANLDECLTRRTSLYSGIRNDKSILDGVRNLSILEFLLKAGADPNLGKVWKDNTDEQTPLYRAVSDRDIKAVELLLHYGADPNTGTTYMDTDETCIARAIRDNELGILRLFINAKADLNFTIRCNRTPIITAICTNNLPALKMLIKGGADPCLADQFGQVPEDYLWKSKSPNLCKYFKSVVAKCNKKKSST